MKLSVISITHGSGVLSQGDVSHVPLRMFQWRVFVFFCLCSHISRLVVTHPVFSVSAKNKKTKVKGASKATL